ncbi:mitochondrial tRNA/rRNA methyltransferase [Acrasis kona]|uniref:Mitochondrial tRNA/rRNA methyltransferase n=1 Tax=Acrasis kona TaxID=1008807 RepID=A0AAW2ZKE4_9EUKA
MRVITSTHSDLFKRLMLLNKKVLKLSKIDNNSTILVSGNKMVSEVCSVIKPNLILTTPSALPYWQNKIEAPQKNFQVAEDHIIKKVMSVENLTSDSEAVVAEVPVPPPKQLADLVPTSSPKPLMIACYELLDPGNMGNIIRTCYSLGCNSLLMFENTVSPYNSKCTKAARGSNLFLPISSINWPELSNYVNTNNMACIFASCSTSNDDASINLNKLITDPNSRSTLSKFNGYVVVMGSEHHGITNDVILKSGVDKKNTIHIHIPMTNNFDSLNVSVACSLIVHTIKQIFCQP